MKYITEEFPEVSSEMMGLAMNRKSKILEAKEEMEKVLLNVDRYAFTRARERKMSTIVFRGPINLNRLSNITKQESLSSSSSRRVLPMDLSVIKINEPSF